MQLERLTRPELIFPRLGAESRDEVLGLLADHLATVGVVTDPRELTRRLLEREQLGSTGIGSGVAIPHCKSAEIDRAILAVGISKRGVDFGAMDEKPVRLFFLVVSPTDAPAVHLQVLATISRWVKADNHVERILKLRDEQSIYQMLRSEG